MTRVHGSFEVAMVSRETSESEGGDAISRLVLDKTYTGGLAASGRGQMLACTTGVDGSAGYVALELVEGELSGRHGAFVLQHTGIMDRGAPSLRVTILPDSGTGDLTGISGEVAIEIDNGAHRYVLTYQIPE